MNLMSHNLDIGRRGEEEAILYLEKNNFQILERNFYTRWGELDLIAKKNAKVHFIEVKTRVGEKFGKPYEAVTFTKLNNLSRPIQYFLLKNDYKNCKLSLDVISIVLNTDFSVKSLKYFENVNTY